MAKRTTNHCIQVNFVVALSSLDVVSLINTINRLTTFYVGWREKEMCDTTILSIEITGEISAAKAQNVQDKILLHAIVKSWCAGRGIACRTTERL